MTRSAAYTPAALEFSRAPEQIARRDSEELLERMRRRRSVREFSADPVPRELIENALRTAGTAPSGANQQPWSFVVISDQTVKERIRVGCSQRDIGASWQRPAPPCVTTAPGEDDARRQTSR
jgi:iodotyrosine deiodinase